MIETFSPLKKILISLNEPVSKNLLGFDVNFETDEHINQRFPEGLSDKKTG
jgi:hypothetical protein